MHACPKCWEPIEPSAPFVEAAVVSGPAHVPAVESAAGTTATATMPIMERVPVAPPPLPSEAVAPRRPPPPRPRRKLRLRRVLLIGVVAGLIVAVGLAVLETFAPRLRGTLPSTVRLVGHSFSDLGFAISGPEDWTPSRESVDGKKAVTFNDLVELGVGGGDRGFRVVRHGRSIADARLDAARRTPADAVGYKELRIVDGIRLDGRRAFRHLFTDDDEYREQWWVERDKKTFLIEFWAPLAEREEAALLNVRIARTFDVL